VRSWPGVGVGCVAFSPDGRLIAFFGNEHEKPMWTWRDRQLYFWDFQGTGQPRPLPLQPLGWVQNQTFTPDGRLITVEGQGNVTTLDATTGSVISSCMAEGVQSDFVDEVQASPDGTRLAIISPRSSEGGVAILDPKTGKLLYSLPVEANGYWLAWSPDSKRLAVSVGSGSISIWSLEAVNQVLAQLGLSP
jgi:WD40 repeat protein